MDYNKALTILLESTAIMVHKKTGREAHEGMIELYTHGNRRIGVMVEINTETEFASRSEAFQKFAHEIALQITSAAPLYLRDSEYSFHSFIRTGYP